jgi:hypothetical protein
MDKKRFAFGIENESHAANQRGFVMRTISEPLRPSHRLVRSNLERQKLERQETIGIKGSSATRGSSLMPL